jgi:hypothetical protein
MPFTKVTAAGIESSANFIVQNLNVTGVITASNGIQGIGIQSGRLNVTTGIITALNFIGAGNTIVYNSSSKTVDISIGSGNWAFLDESNTNTSNIYRLNGNVGIGTTNATSTFTVRGNSLITGVSTFQGISTFQSNVNIAGTVAIGTAINIIPYNNLNSGTLSFEGSAGQLFSITNNLTSGSIFSVNDVSGIPSIDVDANGTVELVPFNGTVGIATTNPSTLYKLDVAGSGRFRQNAIIDGRIGIGTTNPNVIGANDNCSVLSLYSNGATNAARSVLELTNPVVQSNNAVLGDIYFTSARTSVTGFTTEWSLIRSILTGSVSSFGYGTAITFHTKSNNGAASFRETARFDSEANFLIGATTPTGTASQPLQVTGGAYISGNLGIGSTQPSAKIDVNGVISVSAGTTSAPAIIPSGNSNTGVFFPSTNTFAVATNGTEKIKVSAGGTFAFGGNAGSGISTNRTYHFYAPPNLQDGNISYYFESGQELPNIGGRQYGMYAYQRGARYTDQTAIYAEPLAVFAGNYRGVHGVTTFPTQAGGTTEAIFGETTIPNWNYQARHCAVRGIAQGGSTTFSNTYGLGPSNGAFGGHFVAYGKADCVGVYADAYQTASPGAGTIAVPLLVATNGTELLRVTTGGNVNIANGNLVFSTAGKGIDFSATANSSGTMTSELLADYEEGTWTPVDNSGAGLTFGANTKGHYVRVGNVVNLFCRIVFPTTSNANSINISGLPFAGYNPPTADVSNGAVPSGFGYISGGTIIPQIHMSGGSALMNFYNFATQMINNNFSNLEIRFGVTYRTS